MINFLSKLALPLILTIVIFFAIRSSRKILIERLSIGGIAIGLIFLCQPFWIGFYRIGFQILFSGTIGFIVISHRN